MGAELDLHRIRAEPVRLPNSLHRFLTRLRVESIDEHDAVQVVGFMLHAPREQGAGQASALGDAAAHLDRKRLGRLE